MSYTHPQVELESSALLEKLSRYEGRKPDDISLHRISTQAKKLMPVDPSGAHTVLGAIAALKKDKKGVHEHHKIAIQNSKESTTAIFNYAISLGIIREYKNAHEQSLLAFNQAREDLNLLAHAIDYAIMGGLVHKGNECVSIWKKQITDENKKDFYRNLEDVSLLASKLGLTDSDITASVKILHNVVDKANLITNRVSLGSAENNISYLVYISATAKQAVDLNEKFAEIFLKEKELNDHVKKYFTGMFISDRDDN